MKKELEEERHYFVDEAGDLTLFDKKGRSIIGTEGCSRYFILGTALVKNPYTLRKQLIELQQRILKDPYLQNIHSVKAKTKFAFHAKDDCAEVRMEVYKLLQPLPIKIYAIVRRKNFILEEVKRMNDFFKDWRYSHDEIYDDCVKRLFKDRLHLSKVSQIVFARRGKSARNEAITEALLRSKMNFQKSFKREVETSHLVISNYSSNEPVLQAVDYFLWALQRLYERHEDRYFNFVKDKFSRIIDLDDKRERDYGVYYDRKKNLSLEKIKDSLQS